MEEAPFLKTDGAWAWFIPHCSEVGGHIWTACQENWMRWHGNAGCTFACNKLFFFLLAFARKLQSLVIMMQVSVTLQQKHAFSEMKVHICNGHDGTLPSVLPRAKMHQDMCQVKSVIRYELAPDDSSVITSCASHSAHVWTAFWSRILSVKVGLSSVSLPPVTDHFDFLETYNKTVVNQYSLMQGEENQFVLNYTAITAAHPLPAQRVSLPKRMGLL